MVDLHPQLLQDCQVIGRFSLCYLLLMDDANYPWFILVPDREDISEIYQLTEDEQQQLMRESSHLAKVLTQQFQAHKLNIAALGNVVPQLHIHHVVRYRHDGAWPAPVWGQAAAVPYTKKARAAVISSLKAGLDESSEFQSRL